MHLFLPWFYLRGRVPLGCPKGLMDNLCKHIENPIYWLFPVQAHILY